MAEIAFSSTIRGDNEKRQLTVYLGQTKFKPRLQARNLSKYQVQPMIPSSYTLPFNNKIKQLIQKLKAKAYAQAFKMNYDLHLRSIHKKKLKRCCCIAIKHLVRSY